MCRQRRAFLGEVAWETFEIEGSIGRERVKQKDVWGNGGVTIPHTERGGCGDKFSKIAKDQIVRNKLAALNFTLKTWSPDGEFEAGEERPPDRST